MIHARGSSCENHSIARRVASVRISHDRSIGPIPEEPHKISEQTPGRRSRGANHAPSRDHGPRICYNTRGRTPRLTRRVHLRFFTARRVDRRRFLAGLVATGGLLALRCRDSGASTIGVRGGAVASENALPGDEGWRITGPPALRGEIAAYCGEASVQRGETIDLHVSTKLEGARFDADVYRMGWYAGAGGRLVKSYKDVEGQDQGRWDALRSLEECHTCTVEPATFLIECNWKRSVEIKTASGWAPGYYLVKLHELRSDTYTYAIFVLRDDNASSPIIVQASTNTWQAYNVWGDASLYGSFGANRRYSEKERRAYRVSYDRPYDPTLNNQPMYGAGEFFRWEYNFVRWAESQGYDMTYTTNVDVHLRGDKLQRHRLFVSLGHDEYWTRQQYDAVEAARDAGVNLAFFSGNECYWQSRLEEGTEARKARVLTCYKDAALDPLARERPQEATVLFADAPVNRPQSMLSGLKYGSNATPQYQPWRAANVDHWIFKDTEITEGDSFPGIVGYEYDHMATPDKRPETLIPVGASPVDGFLGSDTAASAIYKAESGAVVFNAGTFAWSWGLDDYGHDDLGAYADPRLQKLTANIIERLSQPRTVPVPD